jgi:tRNA-2-methylthio-N6-dimethylallyladenosine synthase
MSENLVTENQPKKVLFETWGCQMNTADTETMMAQLKKANYQLTDSALDADLVVLNTCHIRDKAKHKVMSRLGRLKDIKAVNQNMKIAVAGCVAQAEGKKLLKQAPQIDMLFGPGKITEFPSMLKQHDETRRSVVALGFDRHEHHEDKTEAPAKPIASGMNEVSRYVNITQGCDNFCTFCVVPYTRGREISRSIPDILRECQTQIDAGTREITLLGQNVNSYGSDLVRDGKMTPSSSGAFIDLIEQVLALPGLARLRFTTSNPHDFSKELADLFGKYPEKMGRYIHLPVQSGNDTVLDRMKRKVTVNEFMERVAWLRSHHPEFALSTDLIVGFPGETAEQFEDTLRLVETVRFSFAFAFKYSPRKNTAAFRFRDQLTEEEKTARLAKLNALQDQITLEQNLAEVSKTRQVLFHYKSKKTLGAYYGRTPEFRLVQVMTDQDVLGKTLPVTIRTANKTALVGDLV